MAGLAEFPRGLVTLEEWDALELDETRRWELVEGASSSHRGHVRFTKSCRRISPGCLTNGALPR